MNRHLARPAGYVQAKAQNLAVAVLASRPAQFLITKPRAWATTLLEIAGMGSIVTGFFRISTTAGLMAGGVALIVIGWLEA